MISAQNRGSSAVSEPVTFTIAKNEDGKRLIGILLNRYAHLRPPTIYQAYRKRDIRLNGRRLRQDAIVHAGDKIVFFLPAVAASEKKKFYQIVYQDDQVLICSKKPGILVQAGANIRIHEPTLVDLLRDETDNPELCLCHRIDRQTGGLVLLAMNATICQRIQIQMRQRRIIKRYNCLVRGVPHQGTPVVCADGTTMRLLSGWLEKDSRHSAVYIHDQKHPGDQLIQTCYRVVTVFSNAGPDRESIAELSVELVTGRTHQIRSHFASLGHPILGDGKYGRNQFNRFFLSDGRKMNHQQLWATQLIFRPDCDGPLKTLAGRTIDDAAEFTWDGYPTRKTQ